MPRDGSDEHTPFGRSTVQTACPLDCPDACSLDVAVAERRIVAIDGSARHPVTDRFICSKVRRFADRVYGPDRLHHAGQRTGSKGDGRFKTMSVDHALDAIAARIQDIQSTEGGEAILPFSYGGSNGLLTQDTADAQLFRHLGASRLARTVCAAPTRAASRALYGGMPSVSYTDYQHARLIVIWGANPSTSAIHLVPHIRAAQQQGAIVAVVDPRRTPLAKRADLHVQLQPGTDVAVALSLHRYLFESGHADTAFLAAHAHGVERLREQASDWTFERAAVVADVDPADIARLAELYAAHSPAVIRCGWGVERNRNGGNAALAILALPAVAGKFGVRGGGFSMSNSSAWNLDREAWIDTPEPPTRVVNMNQLGRALTEYTDPPIKMLFVYNCNPVATMPDQNRVLRGLAREDLFTVVFDQVMTDTARWADVVLPATTFLEHYDLPVGYGPISLQLVKPVIEPVGDARPNSEMFAELGNRLGIAISSSWETDPGGAMHVTAALPDPVRSSLLEHGTAEPMIPSCPVQFVDVWPRTPDGKVDLFPEALAQESKIALYAFQGETAADRFPLILISPATEKTITSTLGELRTRLAVLHMHPDDAQPRGLSTDDTVRAYNDLGEVHCLLRLNPDIRPGTVMLPKGLWSRSTINGSTANALVSDRLTDHAGGACFNDARVDVAKVVAASVDGPDGVDVAIWAGGVR